MQINSFKYMANYCFGGKKKKRQAQYYSLRQTLCHSREILICESGTQVIDKISISEHVVDNLKLCNLLQSPKQSK